MRTFRHLFIGFLITSLAFIGIAQTAGAAVIDTSKVAALSTGENDRSSIIAKLDRPEIQAQLENLGISKADAQSRVAALTDEQAASLRHKIDSLPAGGDGIVGALLLIFIILLVTDILGLTKVFPFTRAAHR